MTMYLSLLCDPSRSWSQMRALAERADENGWHAVYTCDHFMPYDAEGRPLDGPILEGWTTLTALAMCTSNVRLGTLVLGNLYRHPAVVASMAATLDHVSGGRVVLGLGAGWQVNEHSAYGIPLPAASERIDEFDEACAVIRSLVDRQRTTHHGRFYSVTNAPSDPKPLQQPLPILIGGGGEQKTLKVVARYADIWHTWAAPEVFARKSAILDGYCADIGRDPSAVARANGGTVSVNPNPSSKRSGMDIQGSADRVVDALLAFAGVGVDEYIVLDNAAEQSFEESLEQIGLLSDEVIPRLV